MYINSRSSKVLHEILSGWVFKSIPKVLFFQYLSFKETCKPNIRFVYIFFPKFCACMLSRQNFHLDHTPPDQNFNDQLEAQLTRRCFETVSKRGGHLFLWRTSRNAWPTVLNLIGNRFHTKLKKKIHTIAPTCKNI